MGKKSTFLSSRGAKLVITQYNSGHGYLVVRDTSTKLELQGASLILRQLNPDKLRKLKKKQQNLVLDQKIH